MAVGRERKPEMSRYLPKNTKTGNFNTQRTLSRSFFVIPERLASIRAAVLAFTANKQTNTLHYIERGEPLRAPDHSLLLWEVVMEDARLWEDVESEQSKEPESKVRYKVPEGYLEEDRHTVQDLLERIRRLDGGQEELDAIYTEMANVMKAGLVQVRKEVRGGRRGQPWFTKKIAAQRRCFQKAETHWLKCKDPKERRQRRKEYCKMRRAYAREVNIAKSAWEEKQQTELEGLMKHPKQWWKELQKLKVVDKRGTRSDVLKVKDVKGEVKQGKEAVMVWKDHFERLLNAGQPSKGCRETSKLNTQSNSSLLDEDITRREVVWALGRLKGKAAPGKDGLTAEMINNIILVDFWHELFKLCWKEGMVPSISKQSVVIPVPKKRSKGPCVTDDFRGISLVSVPYKAMCMIIKERLALVVEERKLVAEKQGGFRKGRGCRDQILTLMLVGQVQMAMRKSGIMAAFIDLKKAYYDTVDREKMLDCLKHLGLRGRLGAFLEELYSGVECEVRIGEELSNPFEVTTGLRQGCVLSPLLFSLYIKTTSLFSVGGERVKVVKSYKYLGCIVNEHMDCREMVRERATAGRGALSAWLWRCRMSVGEVRGKTFVKLMEALVESAAMYGAEVWGSCKWLDCIDQVQLRANRIFLGVGRLHPKTSLQIEMGLLPWKWEAKMRCIQFWHKVMTMGEERLVKRVAMEALSLKGKVKWLENLEQCLADFGWNDVRLDGLKGMSNAEVKHMIKNCAWREVTTRWAEELEERPKLGVLKELFSGGFGARSVGVRRKKMRRILTKLRGGTAELQVEVGRWRGLKREERKCTECDSGEVEDVKHFLLRCKALSREREELMEKMKKVVTGLDEVEEERNVAWILDLACRNESIARGVEKLWTARFVQKYGLNCHT